MRHTADIGLFWAPLTALLIALLSSMAAPAMEPGAERQKALVHLLRHDCGACHGLTLGGGLGPPLDPRSLQNKPATNLAQTILFGRPGTAMPGWQPFLTEGEAQWLVETLLRGLETHDMQAQESIQERDTKARRHEGINDQEPE